MSRLYVTIGRSTNLASRFCGLEIATGLQGAIKDQINSLITL